MEKIKNILIETFEYIISFVFGFIWLFLILFATNINVYASASDYTNVADDLMSDSNFNFADYPSYDVSHVINVNSDDNTTNDIPYAQVIQIAESSSGELYIYTFQPINETIEIVCSSIKLSVDFASNSNIRNVKVYYLELLSTYKNFCKYLVKDFEVCSETYRYYNIVSIYRLFNNELDTNITGGEITEKDISVGQQWCAYYLNDDVVYEMNTFNTLELNVDCGGFLDFNNGITLGNFFGSFQRGSMWYICFSCDDYIIKKIYDADLSYKIRDISWTTGLGLSKEDTLEEGKWSDDIPLTLLETDTGTFEGEGLGAKTYTWNRISSSKKFVENMEAQNISFTDEAKTDILERQWVFAFTETERNVISGIGNTTTFTSEIGDISILRLHFMDINNKTYNLGVVADKITPDNIADGLGSGLNLTFIEDGIYKILMIIGLLILLVILSFIAPIITIFKTLFQAVWYVISLLFKVFKKKSKKKTKF